jgi:hypothetical protein
MTLNITKGIRKGATRTVIYGPEGVGKSTLAAQWPNPVFIDTEDGTQQLDVSRVTALDWRAVEAAMKELISDTQGFSTVIIDSADWLEKAICEHMLKTSGKKSVEDFGYGKGYTILAENVNRFLADVDKLISKGVHVVLVCHSKISKISPPDQTDGYDKYELKLTKHTAPLIKEWADMILFANFQVNLVEGNDGKVKAQGSKERVLYTQHAAAWDAKNRFGLPEVIPMDFSAIAEVISGTPTARAEAKATQPKPAPAPEPMEEPSMPVVCSLEQSSKLELYNQNDIGAPLIAKRLEELQEADVSELSPDEADKLISEIQDAMNADANKPKQTTKTVQPANQYEAWLDENTAKISDYLVRIGWITSGQSWRDLPADKLKRLTADVNKSAKACGVPAPKGTK